MAGFTDLRGEYKSLLDAIEHMDVRKAYLTAGEEPEDVDDEGPSVMSAAQSARAMESLSEAATGYAGKVGLKTGLGYALGMTPTIESLMDPLGLATAGFKAVTNVGFDSMGISGKRATTGQTVGSLLGSITGGPVGGMLGSMVGRVGGDLLGDAMDNREFEAMRDDWESTAGFFGGREKFGEWDATHSMMEKDNPFGASMMEKAAESYDPYGAGLDPGPGFDVGGGFGYGGFTGDWGADMDPFGDLGYDDEAFGFSGYNASGYGASMGSDIGGFGDDPGSIW